MGKREEYVKLFVQDVKSFSECYKDRIVADPEATALQSIEGLSDDEIAQCIRDLKEEQRDLAKHGYYLAED